MNHRDIHVRRIMKLSIVIALLSLVFALPGLKGNEAIAAANYLRTSGSKIVDSSGKTVAISGLNWFGFETANNAPHGLWSRSYTDMLDQIKSLGYNALRIPFSSATLKPGAVTTGIDFSQNPDLEGLTPLEVMDVIVEAAGQRGIKVILDNHRSTPGGGPESGGLWYTSDYPESRWIEDWKMLAARYKNNPTVIGMDLRNEPHGGCWGCGDPSKDWRLAAEKAGNAILAINPNVLIIVEGISVHDGQSYWWGGNLMGAKRYPVRLDVPDRLVYSPHDYPASVAWQSWFTDSGYPGNLPGIWDKYWGYLIDEDIAPVMIGEFGTRYETAVDQTWFKAMQSYIQSKGISYTFWSLNPNSGDTGGLLLDDWVSVHEEKQAILSRIQYPFIDSGAPLPEPVRPTATRPAPTAAPTQPSLKPTATPAGQSATAVESFGARSLKNWAVFKDGDTKLSARLVSPGMAGKYAMKVAYTISQWGGVERRFASSKDWSGAQALRFGFYGTGSGNAVRVEIMDNRASSSGDTAERYEYVLRDDFKGWKAITLPWSDFTRRGDWQPVGAPNDGLTLRQVWGLNFAPLSGSGSFKVDQIALVYAGQPAPTQAPNQPADPTPAASTTMLDDFEGGATTWWSAFNDAGSTITAAVASPGRLGSYAMKFGYSVGSGGWCGAERFFDSLRDWRGFQQLSFDFLGSGSGNAIRLELVDNPAPGSGGDTHERYEYIIHDDFNGWKSFSLPWSAFTRREDWQPEGAPDDGLTLTGVRGINFAPLGGSGTFWLDEIRLVE